MQPAALSSFNQKDGSSNEHNRLEQKLESIYEAETIDRIAERYGLSAFLGSLQSAIRNAGLLYLQYGDKNFNVVQDLALKSRTVSRAAEVSRTLDVELSNLDFWDRWHIYKRLEETGHPITDTLDNHTRTNPLVAGNIIVEEIRLILNAVTRYEIDFFDALTGTSEKDLNVGLYFFVEIMSAFWETVTGERVSRSDPDDSIPTQLPDFLRDCLAPIDNFQITEIEKILSDIR